MDSFDFNFLIVSRIKDLKPNKNENNQVSLVFVNTSSQARF